MEGDRAGRGWGQDSDQKGPVKTKQRNDPETPSLWEAQDKPRSLPSVLRLDLAIE